MRQSESALYTSTMLYIWLRRVRIQQSVIVLTPIILTGLAGLSYVKEWLPAWGVALMAFFATLLPSIAEKLKIETKVDELRRLAADFKSLQDRFRVLANVTARGPVDTAVEELRMLMDRMDVVRSTSITPPERYFDAASRKIKRGDYDFSVDISLREKAGVPINSPAQSGALTR
ncbi:hypothetical protein D4Q52_14780 [Rhodopseudomonas palustris]|uniref:Uncharacterized protein n=2 Tax=Rhodopseudomonas palustris TaxID=1076 RepID=A0A418V455_RHOPL|nr:hypothetical protein D4Q52_14780 [Rhodopseudomonas palustris]